MIRLPHARGTTPAGTGADAKTRPSSTYVKDTPVMSTYNASQRGAARFLVQYEQRFRSARDLAREVSDLREHVERIERLQSGEQVK